ncbi:exonuclease SbcCD subunit D [Ferroglobus sp.]|uniref:metallophosphoesterase family protein n=1 Tax=Ferroglobus sp. TaxID=2614230 RepID=UPI0025BB1544|nr:exonuclease SbcCD subunit D [Ferroglobus sp.]
MRFAHLADAHLGYKQYGSEERMRDFAQAFKNAIEFALSKNVDFIIIAGDLFHKKSEMDPITLAQATKVLEKVNVPVIAVEGNHDASYFRERFTWLDYLAAENYLINLKPNFDEGIVLEEWNGQNGSYVDVGEARIYGLKYFGALTEKVLSDYLPRIKKDGFTIFVSHFGVEKYMDIYGCISSEILHRHRNKIDYVALGHIHMKYVEDDYIFNPGSLESCDARESFFEKGMFIVDVDDEVSYVHEKSFYTPRTFRFLEYEFKSSDLREFKEFLVKNKGKGKEVVILKIKYRVKGIVDEEKVEKIAKEVLSPLVLKVEWLPEVSTYDVKISDYSSRAEIERGVLKQLLSRFGYEDLADDVLKLKELLADKKVEDAFSLIDDLVKVGKREVKRVEREVKEAEKEVEEEVWDWRKAYDQRSLPRKRKKL